jgi:23S rRNA (cytidine1920-2'-O)/16S rRNA (cytidine1409-2'-O)-methyltransferase
VPATQQKQRLDTLLAERGLFASRSRAAVSVMAGEVSVGPQRRVASKPGEMVAVDIELSVREPPPFVSRGGIKLANALDELGLDVTGRHAIDVGASTGGFTDCLLGRGASEVVAVDVGYGDLHYGLRSDPRVTVLERTNARALAPEMLPYAPDLAVVDVSFISLRKVLPAVLACLAPRFDVLALVKPQFEVGRERVGKGGVVRSAEDRRTALVDVGAAACASGAAVLGYASSGLPGPKGNLESFVWLADRGSISVLEARPPARPPAHPPGHTAGRSTGQHSRPVAAHNREDLERMAREVEP